MTQPSTFNVTNILEIPILSRIRRNHGLEHATLHTLAQRLPRAILAGYSDPGGFWIVGDVSTETLQAAIQEALQRLRAGERNLAVHPNCGTNFATAGAMAGLAGASAMLGAGKRWQDKLNRLPVAAVLATFALVMAQPLGLLIQARITTSGDPGSLEVVTIQRRQRGRMTTHRIQTRG